MRVLVAKRGPLAPTETFIQAHVRGLQDARLYCSSPARGLRRATIAALRPAHLEDLAQGWNGALRRLEPAVVLAEYGPTGVALIHACNRHKVPLVPYFHGYDATHRETLEKYRTGYHTLFQHAAAIVAASSSLANELHRLGAPGEKLHVIPCGVDTRVFFGADPASAPLKVIAVGRLVPKKAPLLTIKAFAIAQSAVPGATLVIIGDGPLRSACATLIQKLGLTSNVTLMGTQNPNTVLREMRSARVFVQHSVRSSDGDTEGTPVALSEAHACGLPVVATLHAGIPGVVEDGRSGFLVEEGDYVAMGAALIKLLSDASLAHEMGVVARARAVEQLDERKTLERLENVLRRAAGL